MNLDRFCIPLDYELGAMILENSIIEVEEELTCCGCGDRLYVGEENIVSSAIWEDEFMHDDKECIASYNKKNRAAVVSNSGKN